MDTTLVGVTLNVLLWSAHKNEDNKHGKMEQNMYQINYNFALACVVYDTSSHK